MLVERSRIHCILIRWHLVDRLRCDGRCVKADALIALSTDFDVSSPVSHATVRLDSESSRSMNLHRRTDQNAIGTIKTNNKNG